MTQEPRTVSFTISESFDISLRMLRRALAREGLRVPCEISVSDRLRSELGLSLRDCIVLYVDAPILLLEATLLTMEGSLYVPQPVVLSTNGFTCTAVIRTVQPLLPGVALPPSVREPVLVLFDRILRAIQTIGERELGFDCSGVEDAVRA